MNEAITNLFSSLGDIPKECSKQYDLQWKYYESLMLKMDEYEWRDLFDQGVKVKEKDGDPQVFMQKLLLPVRLSIFIPINDDGREKVSTKVAQLPCLLELKLREIGIYMGPIAQKLSREDGTEIQFPFKLDINKESRYVRFIYV